MASTAADEIESPENFLRMFEPERPPDRRTRKLALYGSGLYYFTRRDRCSTISSRTRVPGWPDISLQEFSEWNLHTLLIHESARWIDVDFLAQMLSMNDGIEKLITLGCTADSILRVAARTDLQTLEIKKGSEAFNSTFKATFMDDPFMIDVHTLRVSAPDQPYLGNLSFVTPAFKELYTTAEAARNSLYPGDGVRWDLMGLNRILREFRFGSNLKLLCLNFDQTILQTVFEARVLRGIRFRRIGIHSSGIPQTGPRNYIVEGATRSAYVKMWPKKLLFQVLRNSEEVFGCESYVSVFSHLEENPDGIAVIRCLIEDDLEDD